MFDSVRVHLTLWYTGFLALILLALSMGTYFVLARTTLRSTDASLTELTDTFRGALQKDLKNQASPDPLRAAATEEISEFRFRDHLFAVLDPAGNILAASEPLPRKRSQQTAVFDPIFSTAAIRTLVGKAQQSNPVIETVGNGEDRFRALAVRVTANGSNAVIVAMQSLDREDDLLSDVKQAFLWVTSITVLLASIGGYFLARQSLAPVVAMSNQAGRMGAKNLHERLPVRNEKDELGHLARAFNSLLERLDQSFERQRQFMADASHELRSPVAVVQGEAQVALSQPMRSPEEYRQSLSVVHDEARRLSRIVEDLFTLARADAGQYALSPRDFYLDELVAECVRAARSFAISRNITLTCNSDGGLPIRADEALLRRMAMNLLENAIKYTDEGGSVTVECKYADGEYVFTVTDTGPGVPTDACERIFERFFRMDKARSRTDEERAGAGLGLPIARWIAEAHHGQLKLVRSNSEGSTFGAFLPPPGSPSSISV